MLHHQNLLCIHIRKKTGLNCNTIIIFFSVSSYVTETHFTVPNLQTGVPYELRVSAENEIGVGKPLSGDGAIVAKSPYDAPGKPGEPDVSSIGRDFVVLTWTRPHSDGGSPISGYTIEKTETGNDRWVRNVNLS